MSTTQGVLEYKCPCCGAGLHFSATDQKLTCEYCDNTFDVETVKEYNESINKENAESFEWDYAEAAQWTDDEQNNIVSFNCPSCGGVIMADSTTAATFCPYCENPAIMPGRTEGGLRPDAVIPFKTTKQDAQRAFLQLCKGKILLPKDFTSTNRLEKITGMYVPFWLYDCSSRLDGQYNATRVKRWSDSKYHYTKTDYYMLRRSAIASFRGIPMDGSSKMDNVIMESIEPFDMAQAVDFEMAYLSGYLADKYDVESKVGEPRIRQRVSSSMDDLIQPSMMGYATVVPANKQLQVDHNKARYVLLPVWMLHTKYKDKTYVFAMNGQTGKMTGTLPICNKKKWTWFFGVSAAVSAVAACVAFFL